MILKEFIRENREEIDRLIINAIGNPRYKNDEERRIWILNDEGLYLRARSEGVKI